MKRLALVFTLTSVLILSGCIGASKAPQRYILLSANSDFINANVVAVETSESKQDAITLSVGLMPINLSTHLDKEKLVQYDKFQQIQYQNEMLWAESLADNSARVVFDYLSILLSENANKQLAADVSLFPWTIKNKPATIVTVNINRFGFNESTNGFDLSGSWSIATDGKTNTKAFNYRLSDQDYAAVNGASNKKNSSGFYTLALAKLSEEIAKQLTNL